MISYDKILNNSREIIMTSFNEKENNMEKMQNIKKVLNTGLGVVALIGFIACGCPIRITDPKMIAVTNIQIDGNDPLSVLTNSPRFAHRHGDPRQSHRGRCGVD